MSVDRYDDELILRLAEDAALGFRHPDDFEWSAVHLNGLTHGIDTCEETIADIVSYERYLTPALIITIADEPSRDDLVIRKNSKIRAAAPDAYVLEIPTSRVGDFA